jgi:DNA-binding GntR family transcriptional regulator
MDASPSLDQMPVLSRTALRHEVVRRLLAAIFRGELAEGTRLIAQKLAARFGISATPVREALLELATVGVVEFPHNRGAVVKAFGPKQLREIRHLRRILETEATRCACGRIDPAALEDMRREMTALLEHPEKEGWSEAVMAVDRRLHKLIADGCGNPRLGDEIRRYDTLVQTVREDVGNRQKVQTQGMIEHLPIIDALLAGQAEPAAQHMARHIDSTGRTVEAIMFPADVETGD